MILPLTLTKSKGAWQSGGQPTTGGRRQAGHRCGCRCSVCGVGAGIGIGMSARALGTRSPRSLAKLFAVLDYHFDLCRVHIWFFVYSVWFVLPCVRVCFAFLRMLVQLCCICAFAAGVDLVFIMCCRFIIWIGLDLVCLHIVVLLVPSQRVFCL